MSHLIAGSALLNSIHRWPLIVAAICAFAAALSADGRNGATAAEGIELGTRYPATIDFVSKPRGYEWVCTAEDVWKLSRYSFEVKDQFLVEFGPSQVVFGHHESNVLWAVVFPDQPSELTQAPAGRGEHITSVWMRFHPWRIQDLFPPNTVVERGKADLVTQAECVAVHKLASSWQAGGRPMVPQREMVTIDVETQEGSRRFFAIDTQKPVVQYVDAFKSRSLPVAKTLDQVVALQIIDDVWNTFDREYAMFVVKPDVDWNKIRDEYRSKAGAAKTNRELAETLAKMLAELKDLHINVQVDGVPIPVFHRDRPLNANRDVLPMLIGKLNPTKSGIVWGITANQIGYIAIDRLTNPELPRTFEEIVAKMETTRGLIIDLRYNGGGNELLAREIAGSFLDEERVYGANQFRNGPRHEDMTEPKPQTCPIKNPWHYVAPVVVLQGQRTMSSAESFVLMLSQAPQVTTMGDRTAGSSGNPRMLDAGAGILITVPRWNPLDAEGKPFDAVGIAPDVIVKVDAAELERQVDPVLSAALEHLLTKTKFGGQALTKRP